MSIAEDIIDGWCCQLCGVYFEEEHGYPVDANTEARTREAGLHLWYTVKFDKSTDLKAAAERLKQLGEVTTSSHSEQRS